MDKKALSLPLLVSLVIGNMIGTGIYILPASLAAFGSISLLSWIFTGFGAVLLAISFSKLSKRFPKTGGPYIYCKEAFGDTVGFVIAYIYWISYMASVGALAVASVSYLGFLTPLLDANSNAYHPMLTLSVELIFLWVFTMINIIGIHTAGVVQLYLTVIKIAPLLIITILGLGFVKLENLHPFIAQNQTPIVALQSAAALTFWAFLGLESATVPAENTRGYRDIFKATVYGTAAASLLYVISTFVLMGMMGNVSLAHSQFPFAKAATELFGAKSAIIIAICAVISGLGSLNASILVQGQIVFAAARDHLFPRQFRKLSKHDVPIAAQLLSSFIITIFLMLTISKTLLTQFNLIALLASLLTLITYFVTTLSELKFSFQDHHRNFKAWWHSKAFVLEVVAALYALWMISSFESRMILYTLIIVLLCIPVYYFTIKKHS